MGKIYSFIEDEIVQQRTKEIEKVCRLFFRSYIGERNLTRSFALQNITLPSRTISVQITDLFKENHVLSHAEIFELIENIWNSQSKKEEFQTEADFDELADKIIEILKLSEHTIALEILSRYFQSVFNEQINSLSGSGIDAGIQLTVKSKEIQLLFSENKCKEFESDVSLINRAIYIDNPFIIDRLSSYDELDEMNEYLKSLLTYNDRGSVTDGIIESVLVKEKLTDIFKVLQTVVNGQIVKKQDEEFYLDGDDFQQPISVNNLSTGLKAFVILKILLEKGAISNKDVLILDEPEIHLHPQWQVVYAELIVLLQKQFDLSVVVTTHSPYFLDAIDLFSAKHGIKERVNYYLSYQEEKQVKMEKVTDNIDIIYQKMASPIQMLDSLRYELNNK